MGTWCGDSETQAVLRRDNPPTESETPYRRIVSESDA